MSVLSLLFLLLPTASAGPDMALGSSVATGTVGSQATLSSRWRWGSGLQLGARVEGSLARGWYIDGWPVRRGVAGAAIVGTTLPLVRGSRVQIDLEVDGGLRALEASDTDAPDASATVLLADVSPMVTLPAGSASAVRLGWKQITHIQLRPGPALEAQGSLLRGGWMFVPSDDLQVGVEGVVGGVFGFDGDGGKTLAQAGLAVRWVPGAARTYTNH